MERVSENKTLYAMVIFATFMWATSLPLVKIGLIQTPPITLALFRFGIASVPFLIIITFKFGWRCVKNLSKSQWHLILIWTILDIVIPNLLQNYGMMHTSASVGSLIQSSYPMFTIVLGIWFLKESVGYRKVGGTILVIIGVILLSSSGGIDFASATFFGNMLIFITAISYGVGDFIGKTTLKRTDPFLLIGLGMPIGTIFLTPFAITIEQPLSSVLSLSGTSLIAVIALGLLPAFLAYTLYFNAMKRLEVSKMVLFGYLIPFYTVAISRAVLGEIITISEIIYGLIIILGIAIAQFEFEKSFLNNSVKKNRAIIKEGFCHTSNCKKGGDGCIK